MKYSISYNILLLLIALPVSLTAQQTYPLSIDELFSRGTENSLRLQASRIQETIAADREKTARTARLPGISAGATAGYIGQPTIFKRGLSSPTQPDAPDWSHNYNVELTQPIYRSGKIHYSIRKASLEKELAALSTTDDQAEVKMLRHYMDLFSLYKQKEVLARNADSPLHPVP